MSLPKRTVITTGDGSKTLHMEDWNEQYHSKHGAIAEAYHVFIKSGLEHLNKQNIDILEIGFGTGLNALITFSEAQKNRLQINYVGVEAYPVPLEQAIEMDYATKIEGEGLHEVFQKMHKIEWNNPIEINTEFRLTKREQKFQEIKDQNCFDLIYFDAFGYRVQPELWSKEIFEKMYQSLKDGGVLVTYAAKGVVRRTMQEVGFAVERLPGPPGKREMLRATK